jgi:hypothetical protein
VCVCVCVCVCEREKEIDDNSSEVSNIPTCKIQQIESLIQSFMKTYFT